MGRQSSVIGGIVLGCQLQETFVIVKSENKFTFWKTRALFHDPCRRELRFPTLLLGVYK